MNNQGYIPYWQDVGLVNVNPVPDVTVPVHFNVDFSRRKKTPVNMIIEHEYGLVNRNELEMPVNDEKIPSKIDNSNGLQRFYDFSRKWEGGFIPNDVGSPTNMGVRLANNKNLIPDYDQNGIIDVEDVKRLTPNDVKMIYNKNYYIPSGASNYSAPIGLYHADTALNMGVGAAKKLLGNAAQRLGGTMDTVNELDQRALLDEYNRLRDARYRSLKNFSKYGKGWINRINDLYKVAGELL